MVAPPRQPGVELAVSGLDALTEAAVAVGVAATLSEALQIVVEATARAVRSEVVVARVAGETGSRLDACAVATGSAAVAAELEGSRLALDDLPEWEVSDPAHLPDPTRRMAERLRASAVLLVPVRVEGRLCASVELMRAGPPFDDRERRLARLAAAEAGLAVRAFAGDLAAKARSLEAGAVLSLAGEALAAGSDDERTTERITRLAVDATGALAGLLWGSNLEGELELVAVSGLDGGAGSYPGAREEVERALVGRSPLSLEPTDKPLPAGAGLSAVLQLGQPPIGALQLLFPAGAGPSEEELGALSTFGVRAAEALRASSRSRTDALELERTRALLAIVAQAISELSLAHTLETAVARVADLLGVDRLAVYLRDEERLYAAAGLGLAGPHVRLAERLLELTLGPFRTRGVLTVADVARDPRLAGVADAAAEAGIEVAVAVALRAGDEPIGMLGVFPPSGRMLSEHESALLSALTAQLAVAVQNAQLHEQAKRLGEERERALNAEKAASRQVRALYEISRSFAQSLSLDATLQAVASTVVDVLDVDVALIGMPDDRREWLLPRAIRVADDRLVEAASAILLDPLPFGARAVQRLFRLGDPFEITPEIVLELGGQAAALVPFLERGWTGATVPIATTAEVLASLTILSLRPGSPVTSETVDQAVAIGAQAALAIDNARLYQQQKEFSDTMQRSLLPRTLPELQGLELGDAYQSSARVEVGGDVYDFLELADGRLAVALGDVTGHGIEAAADMAMAKFVFRSIAREHPEPADFLRTANDVVVGEIATGKFITMVYLVIDPDSGEVAAAGAGHPPPRIVRADGTVVGLETKGLVLGIDSGREYGEIRERLEIGDSVALYTDGVLEARYEGELYGFERLDAVLSAGRELTAEDLAQTVLADCRDFADNELIDDCAVVVVKRTG